MHVKVTFLGFESIYIFVMQIINAWLAITVPYSKTVASRHYEF
jgi:hypothetical protein